LETWVYPKDRDTGITAFEGATRRALEFYTEHIGPYPYEKLASVQATGFDGGMELASAIFYGERAVRGREQSDLVAHEVAHQWFGDSVTERDWDDVWLSEGFATYFALLFTEHDRGRDAFVNGLKRSREQVFRAESRTPDLAVIHDNLVDTAKILNPLVYQKGGWTLHMLRSQLGSDTFWAGIRTYYQRYRDKNATTADFRDVMEETSGQDLDAFFHQWLTRAGSPSVEGSWQYNQKSQQIEIELRQTQPGKAYRLPVEIGLSAGGTPASRIEKLDMTSLKQCFKIPSDKLPTSVTLDPNCTVLMKAKFEPRQGVN
jgi:aminopeptidase N